ncbi:conserved hypothetical protein [Nitrosococcus halophilus Nc 4]|uniref:Dicarboxylate transport domain-containing protein n=1 Tax=Nitrosococcus halophilus (strain Nc4) TaxID=472759 RepID=D5BVV1_NITHN|nr:hypothetical protein [Nitrosococcus halophilus]ADE15530.1 conserved hypothetical protein [Nitrosococcus halophilus Nc 4]
MAVDKLTIPIGYLGEAGWRAEQVGANLQFHAAGGRSLRLHVNRLLLPPPLDILHQVDIRCGRIEWTASHFQCQEGVASFISEKFSARSSPFNLSYHWVTETLSFEFKALRLAGGSAVISGRFEQGQWQLSLSGQSLNLAHVLDLLAPWGLPSGAWPSAFSLRGTLGLEMKLAGQGKFLHKVNLGVQFDELGFSDAKALQVGEAVAGRVQLKGKNAESGWEMTAEMVLNGGEAYFHPLYFAFSETPIHVDMALGQGEVDGQWEIPRFSLKQTGVMEAKGSLQLVQQRITKARVQVTQVPMPALYQHWLEPFLVGTALGDLESGGRLAFVVEYLFPDGWLLKAFFHGVDMVDQQGRFSIGGLDGQFGWSTHATPLMTELDWQEGHLYALKLGKARLIAESKKNGLRLRQPLKLPVLDGYLLMDDFVLKNPGIPLAHWELEGVLSPLSMEKLSQALDWPVLAGKLSGVIPRVRYREGVMEVGGALMVRLFDGTIVAQNLRLEDPLGVLPQLEADIDINRLDLETMTQTFAFGKIEGQISGQIRGLRLANWQPVQFDAKFATPENDPSRHRISQQAVDSLSRLGGGASGLVSRGFLKFFKDFSYDKIGLSCRLLRQICRMGGLGPANGGYYIVRGGGLPRIDVIGYTRQVDWPVLVKRLKRVTSASGSVTEQK